jgi:formylglycine-generating enzyme required for sulfatase activity
VTLPSELEWEKAARGGLRDKVFSWGDEADPERANHRETGIGDTSAVGCFPPSGDGLYDMIGNVWEWTRSIDMDYLYDVIDPAREDLTAEDSARRMRGGSWGSVRIYARCAVRDGNRPDRRGNRLGFRVVLRAAPVLDSDL